MALIFDTHAHYDDARFDEDRDSLLAALPQNGVGLVVNVGANLECSQKSMEIAKKFDYIYTTAGIHPNDAAETLCDKHWKDELREFLKYEKCVALGEIGLDYYYDKDEKEQQKQIFTEQMELANELGFPVIIHDREAHGDCLEIIKKFPDVNGVFHCFSGSVETARELISMGWYISVGGVVTFNNAKKLVDVVEALPSMGNNAMSRLLLETDCPYLTPVPFRGKTNNSMYIKYTAQRISELTGVPYDELLDMTFENGKRFYNIK